MIFIPIPLLLAWLALPGGGRPDALAAVRGRCVEARTASVFAGACHYGAEATTAGREAVIAWHFESGSRAGVDLAGVDVAAAIAGEANLAEPGTAHRSILYLSDRSNPEQRRAAEDFVRARFGKTLGAVAEVRQVALREEFDGDRYLVDAGGLFRIEGALLPDRACCKMPLSVWYRPFTPLARPVVGCNAVFRFADKRLGPVWARFDENTAFAGSFEIADVIRPESLRTGP
jgi:hypothetical protein